MINFEAEIKAGIEDGLHLPDDMAISLDCMSNGLVSSLTGEAPPNPEF